MMAIAVLLLLWGVMGIPVRIVEVVTGWQLGDGTQAWCLVIAVIGRSVGVVATVMVVVGVNVVGVVEVVGDYGLQVGR